MTDIRITLPGPETVTIASQTIDKLVRAGDGDAAILYLYILKTQGQSSSAEAAAALGKSPGAIATAMAALSRLGLVKLDNGDGSDENGSLDEPSDIPEKEPRRYSVDEIKGELERGSVFHSLVEEAQRSLGKILSPDELLRLFSIYDSLRMSPEVILQLITHCISESRGRSGGRMPSMRYIEKAAYTWEREGIFTLDRAEEYLKSLEQRKTARWEIKWAMQIKDREFSESEKRYVDNWIAMGFNAGAVAIAYDRTIMKTGKLAWSYMDTIMNSWHNKNLHTPQEILEKDVRPDRKAAYEALQAPGKKFGAADHNDIERMERILNRIKEE